jgi:hypothetical protein
VSPRVCCLFALVLVLFPSGTLAQDATSAVLAAQAGTAPICATAEIAEPPADYLGAIGEAVSEHAAGHFSEARAQFQLAHKLYPNARTLRGLGMVEFELRHYGESVRYLQAALACPVRALDPALRSEASRLLERASAYVGEVQVALSPHVASIVVDGVTLASGPVASLVLLVGDHELEFRASGFRTERRAVQVRSGERIDLHVALELAAMAAPRVSVMLSPAEATPRVERSPLWRKWWLWTGVGVVVAGAVTGSVLWARREPGERAPSTTDHVPPGISLSALGARP